MPERTSALVAIVASAMLGACGTADRGLPMIELSGQAMGTTYSIKLVDPAPELDTESLGRQLANRLADIEQLMSTYIEDSGLSQFNAASDGRWLTVAMELCELVESALAMSSRTGGAFDVTVGPLVNLWGFGPGSGRHRLPDEKQLEAARSKVGYDKLHADCAQPALRKDHADVYVDLSAYAKGYAVDQLANILDEQGVGDYLVEIGGELRARGMNASNARWAIAVEKPDGDQRSVQTVMHITDVAVATSGDYRNFFEVDGKRYSHTIDPRSGRPIDHDGAAVTVVSASAADADALATALLVLGPEEGLAFAASENLAAYFLLRADGGVEHRTTDSFATLLN